MTGVVTGVAAPKRRKNWFPVGVAAAWAIAVATAGGLLTEVGPWYQGLAKPSWQPPNWLFGPAWTLIFALTGAAGIRAWEASRSSAERRVVILAFAVNSILNLAWSLLFFRLRHPDWALVEVVGLWLSIVWLIVVCGRQAPVARWLLAPYLAWVSFAAVLNLAVVRLNAPFG